MKKRVTGIVIKWLVIAGTIYLLWWVGLFHLLLAIFLLFIDQVSLFFEWIGTGTELEAKAYWAEYGRYWFIAYIVITVLLFVVYLIPYRKVRPVLKVGNRKEGIVIWTKGIRRGLSYEVWDVWNYLKKKGMRPMAWPDPLAIPRGPDMKKGICIVYRQYWSLKPKYLYVPDGTRWESRFGSIHIPQGYFVNRPNPSRLDIQDLHFMERSTIKYNEFDTSVPVTMHTEHLKAARKMIQRAVASNPEINQTDFTTGSFAVLGADND